MQLIGHFGKDIKLKHRGKLKFSTAKCLIRGSAFMWTAWPVSAKTGLTTGAWESGYDSYISWHDCQ
jgi:hypothetical protein